MKKSRLDRALWLVGGGIAFRPPASRGRPDPPALEGRSYVV